MEEKHTPRTLSAKWMGTPPPLEPECEVEHEVSPRANPVLDQPEPIQPSHAPEENLTEGRAPVRAKAGERETPEGISVVRPEAS
jgi:hypothetical protein